MTFKMPVCRKEITNTFRSIYAFVKSHYTLPFWHLSCPPSRFFEQTFQSRSQSFVPLDQRSENESSGSIHFEITIGNNRILVIRFTAQSQSASISCYGACLKWLLPELSFSDRWSRGTKLWERDCKPSQSVDIHYVLIHRYYRL